MTKESSKVFFPAGELKQIHFYTTNLYLNKNSGEEERKEWVVEVRLPESSSRVFRGYGATVGGSGTFVSNPSYTALWFETRAEVELRDEPSRP